MTKDNLCRHSYFLPLINAIYFRNYDKYFTKALKTRRLISNDFDNVWDEVSLLLTPTTLTEAPLYKDYLQKANHYKLNEDYCTQAANMAGNLNKNYYK